MSDEVVTAQWSAAGLRAACAVTTALSQHARTLERAQESSAVLLAQALTGAELLSALALGKAPGRVHLQVECDGPLRGLFADADGAGSVRGYAKNSQVSVRGDGAAFRWRPALGNRGFLSVLRERPGGEHYRSAIELEAFDLGADLQRFFALSEQTPTLVALEVAAQAEEPLGSVAGLVIQALPESEAGGLDGLSAKLSEGAFRRGVEAGLGAAELAQAVFAPAPIEITSRQPLVYRCQCSRDRVIQMFWALGQEELLLALAKDGQAEVTCEFCQTRYAVRREDFPALGASS